MKFVYLSGLLAAFLLLSACAPKTAEPPTAPPEQETVQPQEPAAAPEQETTQPQEPTPTPEQETVQPQEPTPTPEQETTQPQEPAAAPEQETVQPQEPAAAPEQETVQPQEPTPTPEQDPYEPFLAEKAYLTGEEFPYGPPISFCRRDLDGDGKDELILLSDTFAGFGSLWVYTAPEGKVVEVPVDVDSMPQFFGTVKYSPAENALVYTDIRPSVNAGGYGFHRMENGALAVVSSVTWSEVCAGQVMYTHRKDGKNISITAEEKDNLLAETQALDITPLG